MENIEYICTWCGRKERRLRPLGRPAPGSCPRKPKTRDGKTKPHTWVVNKKF